MKDTREYWRRMAQQAAAEGGSGAAAVDAVAHPEPEADVKGNAASFDWMYDKANN
jgi:hypothetical protein